MEGLQTRLYLA